jgi:hypothetical protein
MKRTKVAPISAILLILIVFIAVTVLIQLRLALELDIHTHSGNKNGISSPINQHPRTSQRSPACYPHWDVAIPSAPKVTASDIVTLHNHPHTLIPLSWNNTLPFSRIYFYHIRKAGGTMIRKYLKKVAAHYSIDLTIQENKFAKEEVGSHPHTFYVTNIRDPVERSISHFKYEGRWDCQQLVKNHSFVPTKLNARRFEEWKETKGFVPSPCEEPFSFTGCAVNCYIQSFSGEGCTTDNWQPEYNLALERLFRYNLIFVYEKFKDAKYISAIESFFGVKGFNEKTSDMWCGWQAADANTKVPFVIGFKHVLKLTRLNDMDMRLFRDATSCVGEEYLFGEVNSSRFARHENTILKE